MKKRWIVSPLNAEFQGRLGRELNIAPLTAQLLINRGLVDFDKASLFLSPSLQQVHDPFSMKDMDKAVARILKAIKEKEKIAIYGDYDVDGTTATALLYLFFKEIGAEVSYYIPERLKEGYGLNNNALRALSESGVNVVITTDCGIGSFDEVAYAKSLGLEVIVTDHHEPLAKLPPAHAILNPKQSDCPFPFKELAGVGVAFNLAIGLRAGLRECGHFSECAPNLRTYTDLVALGTIADMVPLIDENRILAKYGLEELTKGARPGIRALKEVCGANGAVKAGVVAFQLAPRINAAGRLENASRGVRLLITDDEQEAREIARELDRENSERQRLEKDILNEAKEIIEDPVFEIQRKKGIVLAKEGWHPGVIGIVASRLIDRYHRPVVIISLKDGSGKGSARGIKKFHILDGLQSCEEFLEKYGGHKMAAGLTIREEKLKKFEKAFYALAEKALMSEDLIPEVFLDAYVELNELNEKTVQEMEGLAPFGYANPEPLLGVRDARIVQSEIVGNNHLKLKIKQKSASPMNGMWDGIAYRMGERHPVSGKGFDIAFIPYIDEWNGNRNVRLKIKDIKQTTSC